MTRCPLVSVIAMLILCGPLALAEDAPRAPRSVRRAARQAERETRQAERAARRQAAQLSLGLEAAGEHVSTGSRIAAARPLALSADTIVVTSNQFLEVPAVPAPLREDMFSHADDGNPVVAAGAIVQPEEFLAPLPPRDIPAPTAVSEPVVISDGVAGVVLPPPRRLDPAILQASFEQLPVAVPGGIVRGEAAGPPLPPRELDSVVADATFAIDECKLSGGWCCPAGDPGMGGVVHEEERIRAALDQRVSLHFDDVPLTEICRHIATSQNINLVIDDIALSEEGTTPHDRVTVDVDHVRLESALDLMLKPRNLAWLIEDEVLKITSRQRREGELFAQVYYVSDLIGPPVRTEQVAWSDSTSVDSCPRLECNCDNIIELIRASIQPESWDSSGGAAAIVPHAGSRSLVIRQTRRGHEEIAQLLERLRRLVEDVQGAPVARLPVDAGIAAPPPPAAVIDVTRGPRFFAAEDEEVHSSFEPYPAREPSQPAAPAGALPDSYDLFGVPTQNLLFEDQAEKSRLILQSP